MSDEYPFEFVLKDKTKLECKIVESKHKVELEKFYKKIPRLDLEIFKDDVLKEETAGSWFTNPMYKKLVQIAVFKNNNIIASATLHSEGVYWQKAAEIKVIVDPKYRRKGIGTRMFNILLFEGLKLGIQKLVIRYASDDRGLIKLLENYGFSPEITLNYYLEDKEKKIHKDLIVASLSVQDWKRRFEFYRPFFNLRI